MAKYKTAEDYHNSKWWPQHLEAEELEVLSDEDFYDYLKVAKYRYEEAKEAERKAYEKVEETGRQLERAQRQYDALSLLYDECEAECESYY